jgi:hypothetical protein
MIMKNMIRYLKCTGAALIVLGLLAGCNFLMGPEMTEGNVSIQFGPGPGGERGVAPALIPTLHYELEFRGPGGQVINRNVPPGTASINLTLALGEWTVTARAYDPGDVQQAAGRTTVTVTQGHTPAAIPMGSSNANLSGLTISGIGTLTPSFDPDTLVYSSWGMLWLVLTATSSDSDASISINGGLPVVGVNAANVEFDVGGFLANSYIIVVSAQDGITTKTYTVN